MHKAIPIKDGVFWIGANDRETDLFEALWTLPRGVSYNSYLVCDDKVAVVDTVKSSFMQDYLQRLSSVLKDCKPVDYLIVNHMEPDHSGSIAVMRQVYPDLKIVGNKKTLEMIKAFYGIEDGLLEVSEGDVLDLGEHKLSFHMIPMVHWPETMVTYDSTTKVLFTCDAFGGFSALEGGVFDDEVDMDYYEDEILRYFANIVGRYSSFVQKAIAKVRTLEISVICPSHGPILRSNPWRVVDLYDRWSRHETEEGCVIVYGSMYGNTKKMTDAIARSLTEAGIQKIIVHDVSRSNMSFMVRDIWKFRGLVMGSCTYNTELFPPMAYLARTLANKMMKNRVLGLCGSYSWSKGALSELLSFAEKGEWELVEPTVEVKSSPNEEDLKACWLLGQNMAKSIKRE